MLRSHLNAVALAALLCGAVILVRSATAQSPGAPFEAMLLGFGHSSEHPVQLKTKGPTDVLQFKLVVPPQGELPWHTHPGPAVAVVTTGALTQYHSNGCVSLHQQGQAFFEHEGHVHRVVNHGNVPAEALVTFILPTGTQPLQPAPEPRPRACPGGQQH